MQSPKYSFNISEKLNTLVFDKEDMVDINNKIKWSEIHITKLLISPCGYKSCDAAYIDLYLSIDNFNENINIIRYDNSDKTIITNYTMSLLSIKQPYVYNNKYSSKITNNSFFTEKDGKIIFGVKLIDFVGQYNDIPFIIELFFR
jgi:hypothetical protein